MVKILSQKEIKRIQTRERRRMSKAESEMEVRKFFNDQAIARQKEDLVVSEMEFDAEEFERDLDEFFDMLFDKFHKGEVSSEQMERFFKH